MKKTELDFNRFNPQIVHVHTGNFVGNSDTSSPGRMCVFYEIELITQSKNGGVQTLDQFLPATPGTIYIRQPGTIVKGMGQYTYFAIIFDSIYDPFCDNLYRAGSACLVSPWDTDHLRMMYQRGHFSSFLDELPPRITVKNMDRFLIYFENAFHHSIENRSALQLYERRELFSILTYLLQELDGNSELSQSAIIRNLISVKKYIDVHYQESLTLDRLSSHASMSREHLCRQFKHFFQLSPMEYLKSIRLFHASHLLITTDMTIAQIVDECGFSSDQYFYQQFKKKLQLSPAQYRKQFSQSVSRCISDPLFPGNSG